MTARFFGIDLGSTTVKAILLDDQRQITGKFSELTEGDPAGAAQRLWQQAGQPANAVATGYGRQLAVYASKTITEITCHARGVNFLAPTCGGFIDVGGQDTKAALITAGGKVEEFVMNDKCAAGTGSFFDNLTRKFACNFADFAKLADIPDDKIIPAEITSTCTVFAESEIIGLLAQGVAKEAVIIGAHYAAAKRMSKLFAQLRNCERRAFFFSGGGAQNRLLKKMLAQVIGNDLLTNEFAPFAGAIGAAIIAQEQN